MRGPLAAGCGSSRAGAFASSRRRRLWLFAPARGPAPVTQAAIARASRPMAKVGQWRYERLRISPVLQAGWLRDEGAEQPNEGR